jgi:hypothetical protein
MMRWLLLTLCVSCSDDPSRIEREAIADTIAYWDRVVGWRKPFSLILDPSVATQIEPGRSYQYSLGSCLGESVVRVYMVAIAEHAPGEYYDCLRRVLTHEMAHIHLTCSDADHTASGVMSPDVRDCQYWLDAAVLERLAAARG